MRKEEHKTTPSEYKIQSSFQCSILYERVTILKRLGKLNCLQSDMDYSQAGL